MTDRKLCVSKFVNVDVYLDTSDVGTDLAKMGSADQARFFNSWADETIDQWEPDHLDNGLNDLACALSDEARTVIARLAKQIKLVIDGPPPEPAPADPSHDDARAAIAEALGEDADVVSYLVEQVADHVLEESKIAEEKSLTAEQIMAAAEEMLWEQTR